MSYQSVVLADSPVVFWPMTDASGSTATDLSGNSHSGTYVNSPTLGAPGLAGVETTAVTFNGSTGWLTSASGGESSTASITAECWFKTANGYGSGGGIMNAAGTNFVVWMTNDGKVNSGTWDGSATHVCTSTAAYNDGNWHYIAVTYDSTSHAQVIYVDGSSVASTTNATGVQSYSGADVFTAANGGNVSGGWPGTTTSDFLAGTISAMAVYQVALTSTQVAAHYAAAGPHVVQFKGFNAGSSGSFTNPVSIGNSIILWVLGYNTNGTTITATSPLYNGASVTGATQLFGLQDTNGTDMYTSIWLLPNVQTSGTSVSFTLTNSAMDANEGFQIAEVSGLGTSPALDSGASPNPATAFNNGNNVLSSGATGNITSAPQLIVGGYMTDDAGNVKPGSPWTQNSPNNGFGSAGYQIVTSSGGPYTYSGTTTASPQWSAGVAAIMPGNAAPSPPSQQAIRSRYYPSRRQQTTPVLPAPAITPVVLTNNFEGGTNGTTITTGNSGGTSGSAFDTVDTGPTFSSTQAAHGSLSMSLPSSASNYAVWWSSSLTSSSLAQAWFRAYLYLPSIPSNSPTIIEPRYSGGIAAFIILTSSGHILLDDNSGTGQGTSTTVLPTGAWVRLEGYVIGSASAGQIQLKIFLTPDSTTPDETLTTGAAINTGGQITALRFGQVNEFGGTGVQMYMDDIGASNTGYLGPAGSPPANVTGVGAQVTAAAGAGTPSGAANVTGVGATITVAGGVGSPAGAAKVSGVGAQVAVGAGLGTPSGAGSVSGTGAQVSVGAGTGTPSGAASVAGVGAQVTVGAGAGMPQGGGNVNISGVGALVTTAAGIGSLAASANAAGVAALVALAAGTGSPSGSANVAGVGALVILAGGIGVPAGVINGSANVTGVGAMVLAGGGSGLPAGSLVTVVIAGRACSFQARTVVIAQATMEFNAGQAAASDVVTLAADSWISMYPG